MGLIRIELAEEIHFVVLAPIQIRMIRKSGTPGELTEELMYA